MGFFFFKQKTAYEMRISDWSSDVCSSDLVRNNGGGFWNHDFFWKIMAPNGGSPAGKLADAIADFGGLDKLKEEFNAKGAGQFGSGWAWLIADNAGKLKITSTRSEEHTSELQSLMRISYAVFCLKKKTTKKDHP